MGQKGMREYRQNSLAIVFNEEWQIFLGKNALWDQDRTFPKGGIEQGETREDAIYREIYEETGLTKDVLNIVHEFDIPFRKDFSQEEIEWKIRNKNEYFIWKEDYIFLVMYNGQGHIDLTVTWELIEYKRVPIKKVTEYIHNKKLMDLIDLDVLEIRILDQWHRLENNTID